VQPQNPEYQQFAKAIFSEAAFVNELGLRLKDVGPGWCETELHVRPTHMQQNNLVHAGVQATMADHTGGAAAASVVGTNESVLTVEFNINLLRAAQGDQLFCRAEVIKPEHSFSVSQADVYALQGTESKHVARAKITLAVVEGPMQEQQ